MKVQHHKDDEPLLERSYKGVLKAVKTPPSRTTWLVLVVLLLAVVLVGSWFYFTSSAAASSSGLWLDWLQKSGGASPAALEKLGQDSGQPNSVQARFGQAEAAAQQMREAVARLGSVTERVGAVEQVGKSREVFERLERESGDSPELMQQCLIGEAKANETLGEVDKAKNLYQRLASEHPNTVLGKEADARAKALSDPDVGRAVENLAAEYARPTAAK